MEPFLFFSAMILAILYVFLIVYFSDGWEAVPEWQIPTHYEPEMKCAVIIPVRNEAENLPLLIQDLLANQLNSEIYHIYVVDDHSEDGTQNLPVIDHPSVTLLSLPEGQNGKKAAIRYGIENSAEPLIICLDGDVRIGRNYLRSVISYFEIQPVEMTTGMVQIDYNHGILEALQSMEIAGTIKVTACGIHNRHFYLANGANMAFRRSAFEKIQGFKGNEQWASGDDLFTMQKMTEVFPGKTRFLKCHDTIVKTFAERTWKDLLFQRKRWSTKARAYSSSLLVKIQIFVALVQFWIVLSFILALWTDGFGLFAGLFLLFIKWIMDYLLIAKMLRYYQDERPLKYFIPAAFLQFFLYGYAAWNAIFGHTYQWKGRKVQ